MNKATPQEKVEDFILQNQAHPFTVDVNETLILYSLTEGGENLVYLKEAKEYVGLKNDQNT